MNKNSISYLRSYIDKHRNIKHITKILNYLYTGFPDVKQICDLRSHVTIDEYIEILNKNLDLYGIKEIDNFNKIEDINIKFSYNNNSYIKTGEHMGVGKLSEVIFEAIINNIIYKNYCCQSVATNNKKQGDCNSYLCFYTFLKLYHIHFLMR